MSKSIDDVNIVMIMEYCDGGTLEISLVQAILTIGYSFLGSLDKVLSTSKVPFATKVQYLSGVAKGLFHLHKNKIVHRDIAARNVLVSTIIIML